MEKNCDLPILIIDPQKARAHNFSSRLRLNGHKTEICASGFRALYLLETERESGPPYLMVTITGDMEDMSAREIVLLTRGLFPKEQLPILFFYTQKPKDDSLEQMQKDGTDTCLDVSDSFQSALEHIRKLTLCELI